MKKHFSLVVLIFISQLAFACKCETLMPITKSACEAYNAIFTGHIDSVSICNKKGISTAYFTIDEVYKGLLDKNTRVQFDCASSCLMSFATGEQWIIYATYEQFDVLNVSLCSNSRKLFTEEANDIYALTAERNFEQEKQFLKQTLGIQKTKTEQAIINPIGRNIQPSGINKLVLLIISVIAMVIIYFITKRKNDK